jgi:ORF19
MNKQELTEKYIRTLQEMKSGSEFEYIYRTFLSELLQLDEPQKPTIPQVAADWIESCKENNIISLSGAFEYAKGEVETWLSSWENQEIFALAWINGYEVDKEKRYYIRLKNVDENYNYLTCIKHLNAWALTEIKRDKKFRTEHTRKELEEGGFGEVFDSPLFEVQEVEE